MQNLHIAPDGATWTTKDGREILISEMSDKHILNTVRYLRRTAPAAKEVADLELLGDFPRMPQGDMASYAVSSEMDRIFDMDPLEWLEEESDSYLALLQEAEKRNLVIGD